MRRKAHCQPFSGPVVRVGCSRRFARIVPEEWSPGGASRRQNPAYRPADTYPFNASILSTDTPAGATCGSGPVCAARHGDRLAEHVAPSDPRSRDLANEPAFRGITAIASSPHRRRPKTTAPRPSLHGQPSHLASGRSSRWVRAASIGAATSRRHGSHCNVCRPPPLPRSVHRTRLASAGNGVRENTAKICRLAKKKIAIRQPVPCGAGAERSVSPENPRVFVAARTKPSRRDGNPPWSQIVNLNRALSPFA